MPTASLTAKGITQLSSATNSTSEVLAATPKAVKAAYDLANGKQAADATLTALAALATAADKLPYFTGVDRAALTALTSVGRAILSKPSIQSVLNYLGLGETLGAARWCACSVALSHTTNGVAATRNGAAFSAVEYPKLARLIRQINCRIYAVSLFVAGMMDAALIQTCFIEYSGILKSSNPVKLMHCKMVENGGIYTTGINQEGGLQPLMLFKFRWA